MPSHKLEGWKLENKSVCMATFWGDWGGLPRCTSSIWNNSMYIRVSVRCRIFSMLLIKVTQKDQRTFRLSPVDTPYVECCQRNAQRAGSFKQLTPQPKLGPEETGWGIVFCVLPWKRSNVHKTWVSNISHSWSRTLLHSITVDTSNNRSELHTWTCALRITHDSYYVYYI